MCLCNPGNKIDNRLGCVLGCFRWPMLLCPEDWSTNRLTNPFQTAPGSSTGDTLGNLGPNANLSCSVGVGEWKRREQFATPTRNHRQ